MSIGKRAPRIQFQRLAIVPFGSIEVTLLEINRAQKNLRNFMLRNQHFRARKHIACRLEVLSVAINDSRLEKKCHLVMRGSNGPPGWHARFPLSFIPAYWILRIAAMEASWRAFKTEDAVSNARCSRFISFWSCKNCIESFISPVWLMPEFPLIALPMMPPIPGANTFPTVPTNPPKTRRKPPGCLVDLVACRI